MSRVRRPKSRTNEAQQAHPIAFDEALGLGCDTGNDGSANLLFRTAINAQYLRNIAYIKGLPVQPKSDHDMEKYPIGPRANG